VSVVLPTRNRLQLLRRAVTSVRAQSEPRFELIIIDDASTDGTHAYLERLPAEDARIRVVHNMRPIGGGGARNGGIGLSRGAWIAFLDDDDEWMPRKLERQLQTLAAHPSAVACSCSYVIRSSLRGSRVVATRTNATVQQLLIDNCLGGASVCLCSSEALRTIGAFDAKLRSAQDLDLWLRLRLRGDVAVCLEPLVVHHAHAGPRITTNPQSQYLGVRRFYFKHRALMSMAMRRHWGSYCCYAMSIQATRRLGRRWRFLAMALINASPRYALAFARRSAPQLARDAFFRGLALCRVRAVAGG
jgi:glycosyltransferase involved in cell wall biosynthesis